ncbi:MAG: hypothetical protein KDC52_05340 [Ignavibacteriae bacterium]|nr:hypothetical protein [Ignavibacteriota bacterium]
MKIEISIGELVDKITILQIKIERIKDAQKIFNVKKEYEILKTYLSETSINEHSILYIDLKKINEALWEIEDKIRIKEQKKEFDEDFIQLARSVYYKNDVRSEIKKEINLITGSKLIEEKEYVDYKNKSI